MEIVGRSSSHFTRVARMFALELGVEHAFRPVYDMMSLDAASYAENPALKVPILVDENGPLYGTENICRALAVRSGKRSKVVLRGDSTSRLVANCEELVLHVMSTEVTLIVIALAEAKPPPKLVPSVENCLRDLDARLEELLAALPRDRVLSFVEVALFCVVTHLPWRKVLDTARWARLHGFAERFGERESARATAYEFDKPREV